MTTPTRLALAHNSAGDWKVFAIEDNDTTPKVLYEGQRAYTVVCFGSHERGEFFAQLARENGRQRRRA